MRRNLDLPVFRAVMPHYVCGFLVDCGVIVDCAPIMGWARGKPAEVFAAWVRSRGGIIELV